MEVDTAVLRGSGRRDVRNSALQMPVRSLLEKTRKVGGTTVHYKVVLPSGYDPAKAYPAILAFGGGPQTMSTVDNVLKRNLRPEAENAATS